MAKQNVHGLIFDSKTGKITLPDGEKPAIGADFTFEYHPNWNPLQYATEETTDKLVDLLRNNFTDVKFSKDLLSYPTPIPPPGWMITAERYGIAEAFNAGMVANSLIRSGSLAGFRAELKTAGILF